MELILKGTWDELKSKLKAKFPQLTDEDLKHESGYETSMLRMVEYKLQKTKQEMQEIIARL